MTQMNLNERNESEEDRFYSDLDKKKEKSSCCTCQTIVIFFVLLFIILAISFYFLYRQLTNSQISFPNNTATGQNFDTSLKEIKPTSDGTFQMELTSDDFTALLSDGVSIGVYSMKDIRASISEKSVLVYGNLSRPILSKIIITVIPIAENGKIKFNIESFSARNINIPSLILSGITSKLTTIFDAKFASLYNSYYVEKVELQTNKMIISGKVKK